MVTEPPVDEIPTRTVTYQGDASHMIGILFGPDARGRHWKATEVAHDTDTDTSRVTFTPPDDEDYRRVLVELAHQHGITDRAIARAARIERKRSTP